MRIGLAALLAATMIAGCTTPQEPSVSSSPTPTTTAAAVKISEHFDAATTIPAGWQADTGTWTVVANGSAPSAPNALHGVGGGARSTLKATGSYGDLDATVKFKMVSGDEGAGLSFRYNADGYRIIRFSVREAGWHYFIMTGSQADKKDAGTVAQTTSHPAFGEWVTLHVRAEGAHVRAWHDDVLVVDFTETGAPTSGAVGPFLRGAAVALFDDLTVDPR